MSFLQGIADWRFSAPTFILGAAILVAVLALLWPAAGSLQPAALSPWERALVTLGIAEVPAPVIHFQGDPGIEVWVDPHSALYYCPGEEQMGKTLGGRLSSQHDAQMDRFEPAGRSAEIPFDYRAQKKKSKGHQLSRFRKVGTASTRVALF